MFDELTNDISKRVQEVRMKILAEMRKMKLQTITLWLFGVLVSILYGALSAYLLMNYFDLQGQLAKLKEEVNKEPKAFSCYRTT